MDVLDRINAKWGRGTMDIGATGRRVGGALPGGAGALARRMRNGGPRSRPCPLPHHEMERPVASTVRP